jgi:hypothetical protein
LVTPVKPSLLAVYGLSVTVLGLLIIIFREKYRGIWKWLNGPLRWWTAKIAVKIQDSALSDISAYGTGVLVICVGILIFAWGYTAGHMVEPAKNLRD